MSCQVGKDIELDAMGHQFEPYLTARCVQVCMLEMPLDAVTKQSWFLKLRRKTAF